MYGFIFLFLVLNRWNEEGRWIQDFLLLLQWFDSFPADFLQVRWCKFSACVVFVMIKPMVVGSCSVGGWCYSGWWVRDLRTLSQFQGSEMPPELYKASWMAIWNLKALKIRGWKSVVVMTPDFQSGQSQIESYGSLIFNSHFIKFVFRISGAIKLSDPS